MCVVQPMCRYISVSFCIYSLIFTLKTETPQFQPTTTGSILVFFPYLFPIPFSNSVKMSFHYPPYIFI
jgi:hypothetical protein